MVDSRDAAITTLAVIGSLFIATAFSGISLPGTQTGNIICNTPILENMDRCKQLQPNDTYKLTAEIQVNRLDIQQIWYKTEAVNPTVFSTIQPNLAFPAETRNTVVNYVLKNPDGEIIATDTTRLGTLVGSETATIDFTSEVHGQGTYTLTTTLRGKGCGLLVCAPVSDKVTVDLKVPNLPLNEYDRVWVSPN